MSAQRGSNRRALLTGAAAAATGAVAIAPATAGAGPDAELVMLCSAWHANAAEFFRLNDLDQELEEECARRGGSQLNRERVGLSGNVHKGHAILDRIKATRAKTPRGRRAKAGVLIALMAPGGVVDAPSPEEHEAYLAYSLAHDDVAMAAPEAPAAAHRLSKA